MYNKISKNSSTFLAGICYMQNNQLLEKVSYRQISEIPQINFGIKHNCHASELGYLNQFFGVDRCAWHVYRGLLYVFLQILAKYFRRWVRIRTKFKIATGRHFNKKAVLSQRWPRNAPYWCPENFDYAHGTIPNIFMGFCSDRPYECSYKIWSP